MKKGLLTSLVFLFISVAFGQAPDTLWTKTFGGSSGDGGYKVQQTTDGGYILLGGTSSFGAGNSDIWLIKTNSYGDTIWTRTFGGSDNDVGWSVIQTDDEGYIIIGTKNPYGINADVWLIKTDSFGNTLWTKTYGGNDEDSGNSIQQTSDGGYIITGMTASYGAGNGDVWLLKTDSLGDTLWTHTYGGILMNLESQLYYQWMLVLLLLFTP